MATFDLGKQLPGAPSRALNRRLGWEGCFETVIRTLKEVLVPCSLRLPPPHSCQRSRAGPFPCNRPPGRPLRTKFDGRLRVFPLPCQIHLFGWPAPSSWARAWSGSGTAPTSRAWSGTSSSSCCSCRALTLRESGGGATTSCAEACRDDPPSAWRTGRRPPRSMGHQIASKVSGLHDS